MMLPDEIALLRSEEAHQSRRMAELDVLSRELSDRPFTIMVTPQMLAGAWVEGRRVADNEVRFISQPRSGLPPKQFKPKLGHVLIVPPDVARQMISRGK